MALWKRILGLGDAGGRDSAGSSKEKTAADGEVDELLRMLEADTAPGAGADFTSKTSTPKQAMRYIFDQLLSGTTPDQLRADLKTRGFPRSTADSYIELIHQVVLRRK